MIAAPSTPDQQLSHEEALALAGRWVAVRHGCVIADARSPRRLRRHAAVRPGDDVFQVPRHPAFY